MIRQQQKHHSQQYARIFEKRKATYHQVLVIWMGAFEKERSLLLLLCKDEPRIMPSPLSPHGPLTQSPFPCPIGWRKWTNFYSTPLQFWLLYPLLFAILHHYHATPLYCSSFFFDSPFSGRTLCFYPPLVAKLLLIFVAKKLLHGVRVPLSPFSPHLFSPHSSHTLPALRQPTLHAWHPTWF